MSWLYNHRDQLDGYRLYAEIAYRFRPKVLPDDRDDVEMDIILELKKVADREGEITEGYLVGCARNVVKTYWRKKYRERRRISHLYEGDKGLMIAGSWKIVSYDPDIEARLDARAKLKTLPKRMVKVGLKRAEGERLNNADKLYLCRQRHRLSKFNWTTDAEIEQMRHLYIDEGLSSVEVAKITGRGRATVQRHLNKLGVMRGR